MVAMAAEAFAIAEHGDSADLREVDYYAPKIRVALAAALAARDVEERRHLLNPPPGWFVFGTHADQPGLRLEFWGNQDGFPVWEREAKPVSALSASGSTETTGPDSPNQEVDDRA
jgi:hypothetical protein